jgi:hypothetical protein
MTFSEETLERARKYLILRRNSVKIKKYLGGGTDGDVWRTSEDTAVKAFKNQKAYGNERATYEILARVGIVDTIDGFWVPKMLDCDDDLWIVEMDLMQRPPYIIDFGKVTLFRDPEFSEETKDYSDQEGLERFEHNWPAVKSLMATLESFGIYYADP